MRSYKTGDYAILKDGNFQLVMARALDLVSRGAHVGICIPRDSSDFHELAKIISSLEKSASIQLHLAEYGENASETRRMFYDKNDIKDTIKVFKYDFVVTDITGFDIPGVKFANNFNITKLKGLERPYIDEFWKSDLRSIALAEFTTVLNPIQASEVKEILPNANIIDYQHVYNADWLRACILGTEENLPKEIARKFTEEDVIFWPFRISDKAYKFEEAREFLEKYCPRFKILVTDPNESLKLDYKNVERISLTKDEYIKVLASFRPIVIMLDDVDMVFHPGTAEFALFRCSLITFRNKLLGNQNQISRLEDIEVMLKLHTKRSRKFNSLLHDMRVDVKRFGNQDTLYKLIEKAINGSN